MSHTVIQIAEGGQIVSTSELATEADVTSKLAVMAANGQRGIALYWQRISVGEIQLLCWDEEQQRLTRRAETLAELRAPLLYKLKEGHGQAAQDDLTFGGHVVQGDARAQAVVMNFALRIRAGEASPHGGVWRLKNNSSVDFDDDAVLALDAALQARNGEMQRRAWNVADAIRAETDPEKLKAFDLAAAWASAEEA